MTTFPFRPLAIGTLAMLMFAGAAAAQATSPILNTLEVQKLAASNEPADNARLAAHFAALAGRYDADARRHAAMARSFLAAPARRVAANGAADHCKRLAQLNTDSAKVLRQLSAHHEKLAAGMASTAPTGGGRFESGTGASEPSEAELSALSAKASTPADHRALAEYFTTAEKRYTADANAHLAMARAYRGTRIAQAADHCDRIVALSRDAAKEATAAAELHAQLANAAR